MSGDFGIGHRSWPSPQKFPGRPSDRLGIPLEMLPRNLKPGSGALRFGLRFACADVLDCLFLGVLKKWRDFEFRLPQYRGPVFLTALLPLDPHHEVLDADGIAIALLVLGHEGWMAHVCGWAYEKMQLSVFFEPFGNSSSIRSRIFWKLRAVRYSW